jgi:hypothetical protein
MRAHLFDLVAATAWWIHQHGDERVATSIDAAFDVSMAAIGGRSVTGHGRARSFFLNCH